MGQEPKFPVANRAITLGVVALLHVGVIALLALQSNSVAFLLPRSFLTHIVLAPHITPPKPPEIKPTVAPTLMEVPIPEVNVQPPPTQSSAPRAFIRVGPSGPPVSHFGSAEGDAGIGINVATSAGGGTRGRGSMGDFEAAVKRRVLARKQQPTLAWDRRNTCTVSYTVTVAASGALAGLTIEPCAIPEINEATKQAIRDAAPFPPPPDLGAPTYDVHGTLIFHP